MGPRKSCREGEREGGREGKRERDLGAEDVVHALQSARAGERVGVPARGDERERCPLQRHLQGENARERERERQRDRETERQRGREADIQTERERERVRERERERRTGRSESPHFPYVVTVLSSP